MCVRMFIHFESLVEGVMVGDALPQGPGPATAWRADGWDVILLSPPGYGGRGGGLLFPSLISEPY